jgi:FkbM family methyltransferase
LVARRQRHVDGNVGVYAVRFDFEDQIQRLAYFGAYDEIETSFMLRTLRHGDVFLDVGANIGYYSLVASQLVGPGVVHAIEPIPENCAALAETIDRNRISNIVICPMAAGDSHGITRLYVGRERLGNSGWASIVPSARRQDVVEVETVTIDEYVADRGIDQVRLVKIDVEGAEPLVISGMTKLMTGDSAPDVLCEINPWLLRRRGLDSRSITRPLAAAGYGIARIDRRGTTSLSSSQPIDRLTNILCSKRDLAREG